jgi:hypothetical protein
MKYGDSANICLEHYFFFAPLSKVALHELEAKLSFIKE